MGLLEGDSGLWRAYAMMSLRGGVFCRRNILRVSWGLLRFARNDGITRLWKTLRVT